MTIDIYQNEIALKSVLVECMDLTDDILFKIVKAEQDPNVAFGLTQQKLRQHLATKWDDLAKKAVADVNRFVKARPWPLSKADQKKLVNMLNKKMAGFGPATKAKVQDAITKMYATQKKFMAAKYAISPSFKLVDTQTIKQLQKFNHFWIGNHYSNNLSRRIKDVAEKITLRSGLSREEAGKALVRNLNLELKKGTLGEARYVSDLVPKGWRASNTAYFNGVATNAARMSQTFSMVNSMESVGVTEYRVVAIIDQVTSHHCIEMNGRTFKVEHAIKTRDGVLSGSPEEIKSLMNWDYNEMSEIVDSTKSLEKQNEMLAEAGFALPPYHLSCRTTIEDA